MRAKDILRNVWFFISVYKPHSRHLIIAMIELLTTIPLVIIIRDSVNQMASSSQGREILQPRHRIEICVFRPRRYHCSHETCCRLEAPLMNSWYNHDEAFNLAEDHFIARLKHEQRTRIMSREARDVICYFSRQLNHVTRPVIVDINTTLSLSSPVRQVGGLHRGQQRGGVSIKRSLRNNITSERLMKRLVSRTN